MKNNLGREGGRGQKYIVRMQKALLNSIEYRDIHEHKKMIKVLALIKTECYLLMVRT